MKIRHVRAVAVFGIAVVALTGARGSHGGGCSGGSHSSSSSGSSGNSGGSSTNGSNGSDYDGSSSTGSTTGDNNSSSSGTITGSGGKKSKSRPEDDVKIESCVFDPSRGMVARVSATNKSDSERYTYKFSVKFTDPQGTVLRESNSTIPWVGPGTTDTLDVAASYSPGKGDGSGGKCQLSKVSRATAS